MMSRKAYEQAIEDGTLVVRNYVFDPENQHVCSHEDWQHSLQGCVVGGSDTSRCRCKGSWREDTDD